MTTTPPPENTATENPEQSLLQHPAAGAFAWDAAKKDDMFVNEYVESIDSMGTKFQRLAGDGCNLYALPMGVKLQRFVGGNHILLVGQFAIDGGDNPRRVYTVEVTRSNNTPYQWAWNVEVKEGERQLAMMTVPGSRCKAEYFGIKVLKADLHRRVRRNERKAAGRKRRKAEKQS
jgi:hypothetical protein